MKPALPGRRAFLQELLGLGLASCAPAALRAGETTALPNPVGYATISWPQRQFPQALQTISALGFKGVQFLGWVSKGYAGPKAASLRQRLNDLKLKPVTLSCSAVNLNPDRPEDESRKVRAYADFFRELGGLYLQVTDGGNPAKTYSAGTIKALVERMNALGKLAQDFGLQLGYHPHFDSIGETREGLGQVLEATDPRYVKLIADVGHMTLGGADPAEVVRTYHQRLILTHLKDVRKDVASLAQQNRNLVRRKKYQFCEIGQGSVDFAAFLRALREVDFRGWHIVELDGNESPPGGPAESARINLDAVKSLGLM
jgi:inosose dehydratase